MNKICIGWGMFAPTAHHLDLIIAARQRRIFYLFVGVWIINLFDLGFTLLAHNQGLLYELNPLAVHVIPHGPQMIVIYKLTLLAIGTMILWVYRQYTFAERALWAYALFCVLLAMQWHAFYLNTDVLWMHLSWAEQHTIPLSPSIAAM